MNERLTGGTVDIGHNKPTQVMIFFDIWRQDMGRHETELTRRQYEPVPLQ